MTNIERAIKGLEICYYPSSKCENCPYHDLPDGQLCTNQLLRDVLTMLKEQEARERCLKTKCVICPHCDHCDVDENGQLKEREAVKRTSRTGNNGFSIIWTCGACGSDLHPNNAKAKYCSNCGKRVKWNA